MDKTLDDLLAFLWAAPTPFHAVDAVKKKLSTLQFSALAETDPWDALAPGRYFATYGDSALLAFEIPLGKNARGFRIVGAHTDSPNLRLKPHAEYTKEGYRQLGVEVYGGVLLNSWLDRDLGLAGRAMVETSSGLSSRVFRLDKPLLRIPQLAIHLDRDVNDKGLVLNRQEHLPPVAGLSASEAQSTLAAIAAQLGVKPEEIVSLDAMLFDTVQPAVGGAGDEFVFSGRLDNLAMCHAATQALSAAVGKQDQFVSVVALFDHEEVGSETAAGAHSAFLPRVLQRLALRLGGSQDAAFRILAGSECVSADMAHALHPNFVDRHEARHRPAINQGPVIKSNSNQRYATSAATAARFALACKRAEVPVQHFVTRSDLPCGSTIGPITATLLGIPTVDVGNPMLSMHSIREMGGTRDPQYMVAALTQFLTD